MARRETIFIIGGCGHVGLPLGLMLADRGVRVILYDIDPARLEKVRAGQMPFLEYDAQPILQRVLHQTLFVAHDLAELASASCLIVAIGTSVDEHQNPQVQPMLDLLRAVAPHLRDGQRMIVRSTMCPGSTHELFRILQAMPVRVPLAYCPERIAQGLAIRELSRLPQIVSGFSDEAVQFATALFTRLGCRVVRLEVEEAELAKLFLNAWRYIQFAIANQFYMMAAGSTVDFFKIYRAMTWGYDRAKDFPPPGFTAGPCLMKDTLQLAAMSNHQFSLGYAAISIHEGMPKFLVDQLRRSFDLSQETVGILGMAFKANIDDIRESLAYKLRKLLRFYGATVLCSDPFVHDPSFVSAEELLKRSRIVMIGAPHDVFRRLHIPPTVYLIDIWSLFDERAIVRRAGQSSPGSTVRAAQPSQLRTSFRSRVRRHPPMTSPTSRG